MIAETTTIKALQDAGMTMVFAGMVPQPDGDQEAPMPYVVVNRVSSQWLNTFCGVDPDYTLAHLQIDFYARSNAIARRQADQARGLLAGLLTGAVLTNEMTLYDPQSRAWRVMQSWQISDYSPSIDDPVA